MHGGEEFEPCLDGVGNLNPNCQIFATGFVLFLNTDVFKGTEFTFAIREDGSEVKVYWTVTGLSIAKFEGFFKNL